MRRPGIILCTDGCMARYGWRCPVAPSLRPEGPARWPSHARRPAPIADSLVACAAGCREQGSWPTRPRQRTVTHLMCAALVCSACFEDRNVHQWFPARASRLTVASWGSPRSGSAKCPFSAFARRVARFSSLADRGSRANADPAIHMNRPYARGKAHSRDTWPIS